MNFIRCLAISCGILSMPVAGMAQEIVRDPIADVMALQIHAPGKNPDFREAWVVLADIGGTPDREVFITHDSLKGDRGGRPWIVYTPVKDGYRRVTTIRRKAADGRIIEYQGFVKFRTDAFHIGSIPDTEGTTLFAYWPGGGGRKPCGDLVGRRCAS